MRGDEEESSMIRYTEFEKWIIRRPSNLYSGPQDLFMLSPWGIRVLIASSLLFLALCLWNTTVSNVMLLSSWLFFSMHYLLGVMIVQFKAKRKTLLFSALLALSPWLVLFSLAEYLYFYSWAAPLDPVVQVILIVLWLLVFLPVFTVRAHRLVQAYRVSNKQVL